MRLKHVFKIKLMYKCIREYTGAGGLRGSFSEIIHSVKLCLIVPSLSVFMEVVESDIFLNFIDIE